MLRGCEDEIYIFKKSIMEEKIVIEITKEMGGVCCELTGSSNKQSIYDAIIALSKLIPRMVKSAQVNDDHWKGIIMAVIQNLESSLGITKENRVEEEKKIKDALVAQVKKKIWGRGGTLIPNHNPDENTH